MDLFSDGVYRMILAEEFYMLRVYDDLGIVSNIMEPMKIIRNSTDKLIKHIQRKMESEISDCTPLLDKRVIQSPQISKQQLY